MIIFAGKAEITGELAELMEFRPTRLPLGSGTDIGKGLDLLMRCLDKDVQKTTQTQKGDWKPIVFLFTDGAPTVDPGASVQRWQRNYKDKCSLVSVTFGKNADVSLLEKLSPQVLTLADTSASSFREFFKWVSASLQVSSVAVSENGREGVKLADTRINLEKAVPSSRLDENFVLLSVKCSKNRNLWLAKYDSQNSAPYPLLGVYPIDEASYARLSAGESSLKVDTSELGQIPQCPECGDATLVMCNSCQQLSCAGTGKLHTCPWCGSKGRLGQSSNFAACRNAG